MMSLPLAEQDAAVIAALADPVRRRLYQFVCAQQAPVSREQAAAAVSVPVHRVKFHLDRLAAEGLLDTEYARLGGRRGPGAGRPSKLYRRAAREISVSLPDREYELAARLMADAIVEAAETGAPVVETLNRLAAARGRAIGEQADRPASPREALDVAAEALARHGYEPRDEGDCVMLTNCPFHRLARVHTQLVCGMNHALVSALTAALEPHAPHAKFEPGEGRCCVVLSR